MSERPDESADGEQQPALGLNPWERAAAGAVGVILATLGIWAVFVVDSEVGPPAIVLIAAVFLLIAIQGTAVRRADRESVELERRTSPREVAREAKEILEADGPGEANAFIEGASLADPKLARSPAFQDAQSAIRDASTYEAAVKTAIRNVLGDRFGLFENRGADAGYDFVLMPKHDTNGPMVACVVKFQSATTEYVTGLPQAFKTAERMDIPFLVITNTPSNPRLRDQFERFNQPRNRVTLIPWRSTADNAQLLDAVRSIDAS